MLDMLSMATLLCAVGSATIGGVFFAFSSFIMKSLARRPAHEGLAAMQAINVDVINWHFLGVFFATAALSIATAVLACLRWDGASPWILAGAAAYVIGTFMVTIVGNVPLNNQIAPAETGEQTWRRYVPRWTILNHIRTLSAIVAAGSFMVGLIAR